MTKEEKARKLLEDRHGIARTAEFATVGVSANDVMNLCNGGILVRVRRGYYRLAENDSISEEQLIASLIPEAIVCMDSALFHYGYSDFSPRVWTLAVPRTVAQAKIHTDAIPIKPYFVTREQYPIGKTTDNFNGVELAVYDRERTICDCFRYRSKMDGETFSKAINAYVADNQKNLNQLSRYAKQLGIFKRVNELMEVLLNG